MAHPVQLVYKILYIFSFVFIACNSKKIEVKNTDISFLLNKNLDF